MKFKQLVTTTAILAASCSVAMADESVSEAGYIAQIQQLEMEIATLKQDQSSLKVSIGEPEACENVEVPTTPIGDSWGVNVRSNLGSGRFTFWRLGCGSTNALVATFTPDSTSGVFACFSRITLVQGGLQSETAVYSDSLSTCTDFYVPISFIIYDRSERVDIDQSMVVNVEYLGNPFSVEVPAASGTTPTVPIAPANSLTTSSGLWFDRSLAGLGFNFIQTANGLTPYYYGYDAAGLPLWLVGVDGALSYVEVGQTYTITMYEPTTGNGANFNTKPTTAASGTSHWGTFSITFDSCTSATGTLTGIDGTQTFDLSKLAANIGLDCSIN